MAWDKKGNIKGQRGATWFTGTGAPVAANLPLAVAGDLYLDTSTFDVYVLS